MLLQQTYKYSAIAVPQPPSPPAADVLSRMDRTALLVVLSGTFMVVLDFFIVMVALPSIQGDFGASSAALQWVVTGYGLANAAGLITGGRLGDIFGRRRMFVLGLALFTLASAACGLAPSIGVLVAARVLQGLAGALLQPQVIAMLASAYTGATRARAFGAYAVAMGIAGVGGQLIGGLLIRADVLGTGWRACFLINMPIGLLALALRSRLADVPRSTAHSRVDLGGMLLVAAILLLLVGPLVEGRQQGWPPWSWVCLAAAWPAFGLLARHQRRLSARGGQPLLPAAMFAIPSYARGLLATLTFYAGIASFYFVLALHLQQDLGWDALQSGAAFSVMAAGFFTTSIQTQRLARVTRGRALVAGGVLLCAGHLMQAGVALWGGTGLAPAAMLSILLIEGAGIGMVMAPLASVALAGIPAQHVGVASGVLATVQQVGNSLGVALVGILFFGSLGDAAPGRASATAFALCLVCLAALALMVATQLNRMQRRGAKAMV